MAKILFASLISFFSLSASAYRIEAVHYDRNVGIVAVALVFEGGEKDHVFTPVFDACNDKSNPRSFAVRLEDTGWDDTGISTIRQVVTFGVRGFDCLPANLTIFAGRSHKTIWVD